MRKAKGARLLATSTRQDGKNVFFTFWTDWLVTSSRWRLELDIENLLTGFYTFLFLTKNERNAVSAFRFFFEKSKRRVVEEVYRDLNPLNRFRLFTRINVKKIERKRAGVVI
jgi:hypothetical protein